MMAVSGRPRPIVPRRAFGGGLFALVSVLIAGVFASALAGANGIEPDRAAALIAQGAPVIDVRSPGEVESTGLLADAVNVPHTDVERIRSVIGPEADRFVVLYCGSGRRVGLVIDELEQHGYTNLVNAGGYEDLHEALEHARSTD